MKLSKLPQRLADQIDSLLGAGSVLSSQEAAPGETTHNSEAYKLYVQGQGALQSRSLDEAVNDLQKALAKDPQFAAAAAKLAEACVKKYNVTQDNKMARAGGFGIESSRWQRQRKVGPALRSGNDLAGNGRGREGGTIITTITSSRTQQCRSMGNARGHTKSGGGKRSRRRNLPNGGPSETRLLASLQQNSRFLYESE